jgi:hypothetical protein
MKVIIENLIKQIKADFEDLTQPDVNSVQNEYIENLQDCLQQIEAIEQNLDRLSKVYECEDSGLLRHCKTLLHL